MARIKEKIPAQEAAIQALREKVCGTDHFIAPAKRYTDIQELSGVAATIYPKDRGPWEGREMEKARPVDIADAISARVPDTQEVTPIKRELKACRFFVKFCDFFHVWHCNEETGML